MGGSGAVGGGGTAGMGGGGGDALDQAIRAACLRISMCPLYDSSYYDSCVSYFQGERGSLTPNCVPVFESYFLCISEGTCEDFYMDSCYTDEVMACVPV